METAGHSRPTFDSPNSSDHTESKLPCAERYHTEEDIYIAGTTFASNRLEMSEDSAFMPKIWALLAFGSFLMVNIGGHFPTGKRDQLTLPPIVPDGWTSLYRFFFMGRGNIITVTLKANPHMSLGESRSEGKGSATAPVLMVVDEVLAVGRITSLPPSNEGKDVILSGTRFRRPPGITASQRCLDPTRFNTVPPSQSPDQQSSNQQSSDQQSSNSLSHLSALPPSTTTTRKETAQRRTLESPFHTKKRRNNESPSHSRIAHTTSNTTPTTTIDTLHLTPYMDQVDMSQPMDFDFGLWIIPELCGNDNESRSSEPEAAVFDHSPSDDNHVPHNNMPDNAADVAYDARLDINNFIPQGEEMYHDFDGMVQEEANLNVGADSPAGMLQLSRENSKILQPYIDHNIWDWEFPIQSDNILSHPMSPTYTDSSYNSQQPLTPQSCGSPSYNDPFQPSPNTPSPNFADFGNMLLSQSPQTPSPASDIVLAPPENWVPPSPFNPDNSTPASPGLQTPSTPLTPDPSPPSPAISSNDRNGRGSISKPTKRKRRPSNSSGVVKPLRCEFPGDADSAPCNKEFDRKCDLKKHAKRHVKPFPCRFEGCKNIRGFSSEKDRERHENCLHKKECLMCTECQHETPRKDNMKDHVIRKHGRHAVDEIMLRIMAAPRTSPNPDGEEEEEQEE